METGYSKRIYQGVRVKHTVKDLLAEKRSQQTSVQRLPGVSAPQSTFVQMTGSHVLPGYYSVRKQLISEGDFCPPSKQLPTDGHPSRLVSCDPVPVSGYQSLMDGYYSESFSDYRTPTLPGGGSTIFSSSTLSTLLPSFPGDTSNFVLRDYWETTATDAVEGLCTDTMVPTVTSSLAGTEPSSPDQYRISSRGLAVPCSQFYPLHPLDDGHYSSPIQPAPAGVTYPVYMPLSTEPSAKAPAPSSTESENVLPLLNDILLWTKEDAVGGPWSQYDMRRAF
ncbi:POU domain class 2-associating factor 2 [Brachyhypopomus gauderio]|uniref:POU domain class 2-associating factor 2 n=1 Tax=Brachyhypopomus gauderio TaxID=698409 RepID=UPI004041A27B